MDFVSAFLGVIAIIGIIAVGGFVIFFLVDLALSVLDPNYVRFGQGRNKKVAVTEENEEKSDTKKIEYTPIEVQEDETSNENVLIEKELTDNFFENTEKDEVINLGEGSEERMELLAEEEKFKNNILKEIEERRQNNFEAKSEEDIDFDKFFFGDDIPSFNTEDDGFKFNEEEFEEELYSDKDASILEEENKFDITQENVQEEIEEESEEDAEKETSEKLQELREKYEDEIAKLESENASIKQDNEILKKEKETSKGEVAKLIEEKSQLSSEVEGLSENKSVATLNVEEYEVQLSKLSERLSENEKDFRKIKKEFIPLRRVNKTLERDEKKLRRKEAIVAKQKVDLYGVNNVADIDQEKAQKLTQELDLLEGLKLSVKHCQEVMEANKERYPLLEQTYTILENDNKTLKADIEDVENKIKQLKK